ncbi:MAG TPA: MFS transporter [Dehalococcoidia bacterium]|nr:MFS transporter [Dehalococcoidia bacterium]
MTAGTGYLSGARDLLRGRRRVYYGWWVLAVGTIGMALGSGLSMSSFGLYVAPLEQEFGWTRAEVSLGYSVSVLAGGLSAPLIGHWVDSRGARSAIVVGGLMVAVSFVLLAVTQSLWQFYVFYGVHALFRQMMFFLPFQALTSRWFERKRGLALSILGSGFSLGGFVVLPMIAVAIGELGWRGAYLFSGVVIFAFFLPAGLIIRNQPSDVGQQVDGDKGTPVEARAAQVVRDEAPGMTLREAARTPFFWICAFGFMLLFFGMMGWMAHQIPFYESKGISRATATLIVSLSAGVSMFARLAMGHVAGRFERFEGIVIVLMALLMAAMATLLVSTSALAIGVFLLFWVIGASAGPMVESLVLIKAFGIRHFATILGAMLVIETAGQILSPALAGEIYDRTGSYDGALILFMAAFGAGLLLFLVAARVKTVPSALAAAG